MTLKYFFTFLIFSNLFGPALHAQDLQFNYLTTEGGLNSNNIFAILQDYQDFIWLGTENGLHRYDGYEVKIYKRDELDSFSIKSNNINRLLEDSKQNLWIGTTEGGLSLYDRPNDSFYNYKHNPNISASIFGNTIESIFETENKILWFATQQGGISYIDLDKFIPQDPIFYNIPIPENLTENGTNWLSSIETTDIGNLWIGINGGGLLELDIINKTFYNHFTDEGYGKLKDDRVLSLYKDSRNRLWIGTMGGGLQMFDEKSKLLSHYKAGKNSQSLPNNQIESMLEDNEGIFWIGTDNGLAKMLDFDDPIPAGHFTTYLHNDFLKRSLLANAVKPIYLDNNNRMWVATYYEGLNVYDKELLRFYNVSPQPLVKNSLQDHQINQIKEDEKGNYWVGSENKGLSFLPNGKDNLWKPLYEKIELKNSITGKLETKIKSIVIDNTGDIWIGTWGSGIFSVNSISKKGQHYPYGEARGFPDEFVMTVNADSKNNIWIGSYRGGLAYLDKISNTYTYFKHNPTDSTTLGKNLVRTIFIDKAERVWVGTGGGGLNLYNPEKNNFQRIHNESIGKTTYVISIYEDKNKNLWIGTRSDGIIKYNYESNTHEKYNENHGLANDIVHSITEDNKGNIWLSTDMGLSRFEIESRNFTNYSFVHGIQSTRFISNSVLSARNGKIIFGGNRGLSVFSPKQFSKTKKSPPLVFTKLWINDQEVDIHDTSSPLKENIIIAEYLQLKHTQNSFSIAFAALEYNFSDRTIYSYRLEGFQDQWQNIGFERKATFTNLDPGEYLLHIKATNRDGFTNHNPKTLKIYIKPAWYQTSFFRFFVAVILLILVYAFFRIRFNYLMKQRKMLKKEVNERTKELYNKNQEVLTQNEELLSQNEHISAQREKLERTQLEIKKINETLEQLVDTRTEKLKRTVKELNKTVYELDRFVYSASHDLSAPLKSITGLVQIAQIESDKKRIPEYLDYIKKSISKLEEVIKNLVLFSRNKRLKMKPEPVNVLSFVNGIIEDLAFLPTAKNFQIIIDINPEEILIIDKQRLKMILHNLINNAIKYADFDKPNPSINISIKKEDRKYMISIIDNGIGIEHTDQKKIFDMFYRATEKSDGSGLGLFIVKESLLKLKGKIKVESEPGLYSKFTIVLPS